VCFSATASFAAGTGLAAAGVYSIGKARNLREWPYAAIPLLFGVQQLIEGVIWITFRSDAPVLNPAMTFAYSLFSHVLWPVYIPFAALAMEPAGLRRQWMLGLATAGGAAGLFLLFNMFRFPIQSRELGGHIEYVSPHFFAAFVMAGYLAGTCLSPLLSSYRYVVLFGAAALASFLFSYAAYTRWFISVWCFFAAALSVIVLAHMLGPKKVPA
jgi:hypothetical protein